MKEICMKRYLMVPLAGLALLVVVSEASAQSSPGQNWSAGWGFQTANDRAVGLSRANAIMQAEKGPTPTTVMNTTNYNTTDNRSNYVDVTTAGDVSTDYQIGDDIGQNTNSVGSMNTGNTTIDINGDSNSIHAINSADNTGCVDGSALTNTMGMPLTSGSLGLGGSTGSLGLASMAGGGVASAGAWGMGSSAFGNIASPTQDCTP